MVVERVKTNKVLCTPSQKVAQGSHKRVADMTNSRIRLECNFTKLAGNQSTDTPSGPWGSMELLCHCETPALRTKQWGTVSGITIRLSPTERESLFFLWWLSDTLNHQNPEYSSVRNLLRPLPGRGQMFLRHYVRIASYLTGNRGNWPEREAYHLPLYSAKAQKSTQLHIHAI